MPKPNGNVGVPVKYSYVRPMPPVLAADRP